MSIHVRELPGRRDLLALAAADPHRYPALLESAVQGSERARYDILFASSGDQIRLDQDGRVRGGKGGIPGTSFLDALDTAWRTGRIERTRDDVPFRGGWLLYLGYELAAQIEPKLRLPASVESSLPIALALRCPAAIIVDHLRDSTMLVAEEGHEPLFDAMAIDVENVPASVRSLRVATRVDEDDPRRFLDNVARVHEYLRAGDVFQVNLSREWRVHCDEEPVPAAVHAALREANPAPFAALLQYDGWAIASSSPERLIEVRGELAQTRPIAGTRPRASGDDEAALVRELIAHPKERAEHVMLIDLERNDLGRVCRPGSVEVDELMSIESYAHVHHIVSNVRGRLRPDATPGEIVRAVFPGGTITGCPKVRCMEIIAELEGVARGAYTGSLGYLNRDGDLDLNILIRTLTIERSTIRFRAGAGIVADSVAERELDETRAKARGLLRALGIQG
ncbi:MAG TPA: aminodeoxychorismate synthase component I [Rhodanobacteraceae bacterium]|jgi:anthranilate synthase component 1|nr:aminodeoxychorismate synthase component I [Rhodanobacteraceae bacterium]